MQPQVKKIAAGLVVFVALIVVAASVLRPVRSEVVSVEVPVLPVPEPGTAIVALLRESGGFSLLGIRIADTTHHVEVQFLAEPGCTGLLGDREPWPTAYPQCSAPIDIVGNVGGVGVTQSGDSLVGVEIEVPRACFEQLEPGMEWPPDLPECALR